MNPVLLKPQSERGAQLVVRGRWRREVSARDYAALKAGLMPEVLASYSEVAAGADLVLVEGAGSPAETNLRAGDIANMGFAAAAGLPVAIVGDIDRGGVIASLVGTHAVLAPADRALVKGFIVNKFRGDPSLFADGEREIARRTGWAALGLVPHFPAARLLPAEDSVDLDTLRPLPAAPGRLKIAVPRLPRIANFDDLDPLRLEPGIELVLVQQGDALPGDAGLVILAGSKATVADLACLRGAGWDIDIAAHRRRGGWILGLCGGYQMLGRTIADPVGIEGPPGVTAGLGLLDVETVLGGEKATRRVPMRHVASGIEAAGYEIHLGSTTGPDCARPVLHVAGRPDGARSADGRVMGTYVHGLFSNDALRAWLIADLGGAAGSTMVFEAEVEAALDGLAHHLESHLDWHALLEIADQARTAQSA